MTEGERQKDKRLANQAATILRLKREKNQLQAAIGMTRSRPGHYAGCMHPDTPCTTTCKKINAILAKIED